MTDESSQIERVISEVVAERAWQDEKWGGPAHDDTHSVQDFVAFIHEHAEKAIRPGTASDITCSRLVEVAALAVAAVESIRRKDSRSAGSRGHKAQNPASPREGEP